MCLFILHSVCLSVSMPLYYLCLYDCLSVFLPAWLHDVVCKLMCLFILHSVCLSVCMPLYNLYLRLSVCFSVYLAVCCLFVSLCACVSVCLSICTPCLLARQCVSLSVILSVFLSESPCVGPSSYLTACLLVFDPV
jgi:hypothetical protein